VIVLDTSVLIDTMVGAQRSAPAVRQALAQGEWLLLPTLVLYEWLRGPRREEELAMAETVFRPEWLLPFTSAEATAAARLYGRVSRARGREVDIAIAAHAIVRQCSLWTLNAGDFEDLPGLRLYLSA
jgi:predicted nucleic acid-binding protein